MKEVKPDKPLESLLKHIPQKGVLEWIGLRPYRKHALKSVATVSVSEASGLEGDHFSSTYSKKRQVTLIQKEHLEVVASILGEETIDPGLLRRNLVVSKINLLTLVNIQFNVGEVILEGTGHCHPCSRMEENLGPGGYNAMRGHGGITAKVIRGGEIRVGDKVSIIQ